MFDVASKLGPALQVGESLVWQAQQSQPSQQQQQQQQQPHSKATPTAATQASAPPREVIPSAPIPDPTPPPAYPSGSSAPPIRPAAIAGAAPSQDAPPSYEESVANAPEPPTHDPNRDASRLKSRQQLPAL